MMLQMLTEIDSICRSNGIRYQLFAGSALGAARHQGFIPWDDDLDVVMLRPEYERFLEIAAAELDSDKYYLQREFSQHWPVHYSKLRRNGTACIERFAPRDRQMHQGVYVDIFPCDNLSDNVFMRWVQFAASKVVIAKSLSARGYITDSYVKKLFLLLCRVFPLDPLVKLVKNQKRKDTKMVHTFFGASSKYKKSIYPRRWLTETKELLFENAFYPVSVYLHELLTVLYGDYMIPTPENKRGCKVHAEIVDLEHSYENYAGIQEKMQFHEYTKSIR